MITLLEMHRMSIHNGPGIRTMVHLKGCPLRCIWCSTPDSQMFQRQLWFQPEKCIGCGKCMETCSFQAIYRDETGRFLTHFDRCQNCMACIEVCDTLARKSAGKEISVSQLKKEILKDRLFYESSGGGVVFSGGEVMSSLNEELLLLLKELKEEEISIGIDTSGFASKEAFMKVFPYTDYFLWDLKQMDAEKHRDFTGVDLKMILDNLYEADRYGIDIYLRCPIIPGFNDDEDHLEKVSEVASSLRHLKEIHLIPFHHMGISRYACIGRQDPLKDLPLLSDEAMEEKTEFVRSKGLPVRCIH